MLQRAKTLLNLAGDKLYGLPLLVLYLTDGCNSRCVSCDIWQNPRLNMPLQLAKSLADAAPECDMRWVLLSGGEALQHPQWAQIAGMFKAQGVRVMLLTNGLFVKKYVDDIAQTVDDLIVSLDGGNAHTYHALRGVDAFALVLEGIREARTRGVSVTTRTTVQRANWHEMAQIIDVGLAHDVNSISFLAVDVSNGQAFGQRALAEQSSLLPTLADVDALEQQINDIAQAYTPHFASGRIAETPAKLQRTLVRYFRALHGAGTFAPVPCNAPHFSVVVGVDGTLMPCYFLPAFGKLKPNGAPLRHALNSAPAQALRQAYKAGQRHECQTCVCPLYKDAKTLWGM